MKKYGIILCGKEINQDNINGPCLIKVPEFIINPLGKYYLYFAHHKGKYIRMAYSDNILGPYKLYEPGTLHLSDISGYDHIASPDVIIDYMNSEIIMYYHCKYNNGKTPQSTFHAISKDGLNFFNPINNINILHPYFRYFKFKEQEYGIAMYGLSSSILMKKNNNTWEVISKLLPKSRHTHVIVLKERIFILYSIVGDNPEHIMFCELIIHDDKIEIINNMSLIFPQYSYEHMNIKSEPSQYGAEYKEVNQLRDPYIIEEDNILYIMYTVGGEQGIALFSIPKEKVTNKFSPKLLEWYNEAYTEVGIINPEINTKYALYPKRFYKTVETLDQTKKYDFIFIGSMTNKNREWILEFIKNNFTKNSYLEFIDIYTMDCDGFVPKEHPIKNINYFERMCNSMFCLCPEDDMMYSMRFYEAIMCRTIPIVNNIESTYRSPMEAMIDYKYYMIGDMIEYREDWVEHNYKLFIKYHTLCN
jgi:hypothetical protein